MDPNETTQDNTKQAPSDEPSNIFKIKKDGMTNVVLSPEFIDDFFIKCSKNKVYVCKGITTEEKIKLVLGEMAKYNFSHIDPDSIKIEDKRFAEGACGPFFRGIDKVTGEMYAVKKFSNNFFFEGGKLSSIRDLIQKIYFNENLKHPRVPEYKGLIIFPNQICMVMTFIVGKSLRDKIATKELSNDQKYNFVIQLALIVKDFHDNGIILKNLNPDNCMITNDNVLFLLGINKITVGDRTITCKGNPMYYPPENFDFVGDNYPQGDDVNTDYIYDFLELNLTTDFDIWSLGCIISELFSGMLPWNGRSNIMQFVQKKPFPIPKNLKLDSQYEGLTNLLSKCFVYKPTERIRIKELLEELVALKGV